MSNTNDMAVRTVDLVKQYEGGAINALAGVSVEIARGEHLCICPL